MTESWIIYKDITVPGPSFSGQLGPGFSRMETEPEHIVHLLEIIRGELKFIEEYIGLKYKGKSNVLFMPLKWKTLDENWMKQMKEKIIQDQQTNEKIKRFNDICAGKLNPGEASTTSGNKRQRT